MQLDDCTTLTNMMLSGNTVIAKHTVSDECLPYADYDEMRDMIARNLTKALSKAEMEYLATDAPALLYCIYNESGEMVKTIRLTCEDVLKYY